jgi:hypothetical protein
MTLLRMRGNAWPVLTATANVISWQAAMFTLAALVVVGVLRLCTERQRRQTLLALVTRAPEGTVVMQQDGPEGHAMRLTLGRSATRCISRGP